MLKAKPSLIPTLLANLSTLSTNPPSLSLNHPLLSYLESKSPSTPQDFQKIHAKIITSGLFHHPFAASRLIKFCSLSPSPDLPYALTLLSQIPSPDLFTWNTLIKGFALSRTPSISVLLYRNMLNQGARPNAYTFPVLINACSRLNSAQLGASVHGDSVKSGFYAFVVEVQNSLIHMYSAFGLVESARRVFDEIPQRDMVSWITIVDGLLKCGEIFLGRELFNKMPERDVVAWNVMVNGFVRNSLYKEALGVFGEMQGQGFSPNETTLVNLISACANSKTLGRGKCFHGHIVKCKLGGNLLLTTSLIDMYAKCGCLDEAEALFERVGSRDLVAWNAMINGHARYGDVERAIALFEEMVRQSIMPDAITFVGVLTACSRAALVDKGLEYFKLMTSVYNTAPELEHYGCIVSLLGCAGLLSEAEKLVQASPVNQDPSIWASLLNACKTHGNIEMGERVRMILVTLDPNDRSQCALVSNVVPGGGKQDETDNDGKIMQDKGIQKVIGVA